MKSTLLTLELKRTELLSKFDPTYRPKSSMTHGSRGSKVPNEAEETPCMITHHVIILIPPSVKRYWSVAQANGSHRLIPTVRPFMTRSGATLLAAVV
jgi:hypothetical protein